MCPVCRHPKRLKIEAQIIAGASLRDIARQFAPVSKDSVAQHKNVCLKEAIQAVKQEQQVQAGISVLDRLAQGETVIDNLLEPYLTGKTTADIPLDKALALHLKQVELRAELERDQELEHLTERFAELEQQLAALLARRSA